MPSLNNTYIENSLKEDSDLKFYNQLGGKNATNVQKQPFENHFVIAPTINIINRMALAVPYYYSMFSRENIVCGSVFNISFNEKNSCEPSLLVYARMFGNDGFSGRGTAPAASHITGYALDGWIGAIFCITITGIIIGGFLAVWPITQKSNMFTTIFVMGSQAAYFCTQLPFEGPIIYSHGILWWGLLVVFYGLFVWCWEKCVRLNSIRLSCILSQLSLSKYFNSNLKDTV